MNTLKVPVPAALSLKQVRLFVVIAFLVGGLVGVQLGMIAGCVGRQLVELR